MDLIFIVREFNFELASTLLKRGYPLSPPQTVYAARFENELCGAVGMLFRIEKVDDKAIIFPVRYIMEGQTLWINLYGLNDEKRSPIFTVVWRPIPIGRRRSDDNMPAILEEAY